MNRAGKVEPTPPEYALAAEIFDHFCSACTMKQILGLHREICNTLNLKPNRLPEFYPKLKTKLASSWKAQALFKKFDARANHKVYEAGHACDQSKALIIGAGPCGLRAAIECQLLGAKVVVVEKRDRMSRNNVLHLWPFVIQDLRALGAKKFFGKFCAGSIDHISIRQLQCILLKVALLLGVEVYEGVSFEELLEPSDTEDTGNLGWRARLTPHEHPVSLYEFDVLIGADGKRNTLQAFKRNEFRGKLALAITANFINRHTEQEASVPEINGVSFIFNQKFFKDLNQDTGIDLENIVYYKDDTHYFVMTAKKPSLLDKGVLLNDYAEISRLLNVQNVDRAALMRYAQEAAHYSTEGKLPLRDFALNHYGEPDVALFDFTSMYAAENASMVYQRHGRQLLCQLVGDSLLEPFWPTGSGCARGFLSALDAAWAVRSWNQIPTLHPLDVIAERESIYRLLAQTTPENLHRDLGAYTLDPGTRYPNLNRVAVTPHRVTSFYDSDDPLPLGATAVIRKRKRGEVSEEALIAWVGWSEPGLRAAASPMALKNLIRRYRPDLLPVTASTRQVYYLLQHEYGIVIPGTSGSVLKEPSEAKLHFYLTRLYHKFKGEVPYVHQHSDIFEQIKQNIQKEKLARNTADNSIKMYSNAADAEKSHSSYRKKRRSVRTPQEEGRLVGAPARKAGEGARVAQLAAELAGTTTNTNSSRASKPKDLMRSVGKIERDDWNVKEIERKITENRLGRPEPKAAERVPKWDREQFLGRQRKLKKGDSHDEKWIEIDKTLNKLDQKLRDSGRPDHGTKKVANLATKFIKKDETQTAAGQEQNKRSWRGPTSPAVKCAVCALRVFAAEGVAADGIHVHRSCFNCFVCKTPLKPGNYTTGIFNRQLFCLRHSGVTRPDVVAVAPLVVPQRGLSLTPTPERISVELSDSGAREIDEDEWTDRNFLLSETSGAGGLSDDDDESSSDEYTDAADSDNETTCSPEPAGIAEPRLQHFDLFCSEDSYGYDAYSDDGAESSGNESCSRMRAAREARRSEVPTDHRLPTDSSEVESEDESESSDHEISSATEVSTDSEFAREVCTPAPSPPAIIVTEINIPVPPTLQDNPLSRTRSTGGLATKRALELKRRYLLGESSPPAVRKSDSTSQLDTKLEAFRTNITEFQKLLHHSPPPNNTQQQPDFQKSVPDEVKKKYNDSPDMLIKVDTLTKNEEEKDLDSDSLSDDYSHIESSPNQTVPRLEVHNEGGELVQFDSIMHIECNQNQDEKPSTTKIVLVMESESFESCRDIMSLALAETELSDWATESAALDNFGFDIEDDGRRCKNPRTLNEPKTVHDAENTIWASHVCGRTNPDSIIYSNAVEHFQYADEGDEVPSIETSMTMRNEGYMEFVDDLNLYSPRNDRSITFVERSFPEMVMKPSVSDTLIQDNVAHNSNDAESTDLDVLPRLQLVKVRENIEPLKSTTNDETIESIVENTSAPKTTKQINHALPATNTTISSAKIRPFNSELYTSLSENCPRLNSRCTNASHSKRLTSSISSPALTVCPLPLQDTTNKVFAATATPISSPTARTLKFFAPAICKSDSNNFQRLNSSCTNSSRDTEMPSSVSPSASPVCFVALQDTTNKVQKIKKEREEQTEVVRRLVLERLGSGLRVNKRSTIRMRVSPASNVPPPVPPLPVIKTPSPTIRPDTYTPPPRPALPVMPTPVTSSFSDPELARERRSKSIMKTVSSYLRRRLGFRHKWASESDLTPHVSKELFQATPSANEMTLLRYGFPHFPPPSVPPASSDYTRRYTNDTLVVDYMFKWLYDEGGGPEAHSNVSSVITESISENIAHRCMETRNEMSVAHSIGSSDPSGNSEVKYIRQWIQAQASEFEARKYCPSHENDNRPDLEHQWAEARRTMLQACRSEPNCPSASSSVRSEGSTSPIGIVNHETPVIRLTPGVGSSSARVVNNNTRVRQSTRRISSSSARIAKYETTSKRSFRPVTNLSVISFDNSSDNYGSNPASVCASEGSVDNDAHQEKWCLPINTTQFDTITETFTEPRADEEDNTQQPSIYEWLETELTSECKSTWDTIPTGAHLERVQQCLKRRLFGYKRKAINTLMKKSFDRCVARNSDGTFYSLALDREDFRRILYQLLQSFDYLNHGLDTVRKWTACRVARHNAQFLLILKEIDEDSVGVIVKRENFMKRKVIRELKKLIAAEMDKALKQLLDNKMAHNKNKKDTDCM